MDQSAVLMEGRTAHGRWSPVCHIFDYPVLYSGVWLRSFFPQPPLKPTSTLLSSSPFTWIPSLTVSRNGRMDLWSVWDRDYLDCRGNGMDLVSRLDQLLMEKLSVS
jgi:hypothetical protein